ncbi:efflux RND transporter periplasmic adaptor subunit [Phaeobacter sp. 22II1-1F12B]|uniref:efflux RND transporter periplasmic adaptor subunit n=1 Tax=Phaeobacter sp. 22II1-1F12B TaxID=1317111 RepID=UPI000B527D87|nr:hemolysin D [Phaeobacter sp. 22II1-1F12B]
MIRNTTFQALAASFVLGSVLATGNAVAQNAAPTVTVVTLASEDVTLTTTLPGRVKASEQSEVRPQVVGIITEQLFKEGETVEAGDPLYKIDPATYEAAVAQAKASVNAAQAQLDAAERDEQRIEALAARNVSSQQALDDSITARDSARAQLEVARAQLQSSQIELDKTTIHARLSGEIGLSMTSRGALVTNGQADPLTVIRVIDPVFVDVTQSAADLLAWRRQQQSDVTEANGEADVTLILADGTEYEHAGRLTAAEPHVDEQTGVVLLRMSFANPDKLLLPGMYVQVNMPTTVARDVILTPQEAVSRDRRGRPTALVVNSENVVELRNIEVLQDQGSDWVVASGLETGDRVIVEGLQIVAPGATVNAEEREAPAETE